MVGHCLRKCRRRRLRYSGPPILLLAVSSYSGAILVPRLSECFSLTYSACKQEGSRVVLSPNLDMVIASKSLEVIQDDFESASAC